VRWFPSKSIACQSKNRNRTNAGGSDHSFEPRRFRYTPASHAVKRQQVSAGYRRSHDAHSHLALRSRICNLAHEDVGRGLAITVLDKNRQAARACRLRYPFARDSCLRVYNWNFAAARAGAPVAATIRGRFFRIFSVRRRPSSSASE